MMFAWLRKLFGIKKPEPRVEVDPFMPPLLHPRRRVVSPTRGSLPRRKTVSTPLRHEPERRRRDDDSIGSHVAAATIGAVIGSSFGGSDSGGSSGADGDSGGSFGGGDFGGGGSDSSF